MFELRWRCPRRGAAHLLTAAVCLALLTACWDTPSEPHPPVARAASEAITAAEVVDGEYVVVFVEDLVDPVQKANELIARMPGSELLRIYQYALKGFAGAIPQDQLPVLREDPEVAYVQPNFLHELADDIATLGGGIQTNATWGLDRIDQRDLPLDQTFRYPGTGADVWVYILDSGIRFTHEEFGGRATFGADFHAQPDGGSDCHGHGTHVAGTVGGTTYGVAKEVNLVAVRVGLPCPSPYVETEQLLAAADWITGQKIANPGRRMLVNMSIGGPVDQALDAAVGGSIAHGITWVLAAGNGNANACFKSPARVPEAVTVGATRPEDARAAFSNWGSCVDLFAPGQGITSASLLADDAVTDKDGTSMAAPHVAGTAALFLEGNPGASPADVAAWLVSNATPDRLATLPIGSPNLLLFLPEFTTATVEISIDIMPSSAENPVKLSRNGTLPVAVLADEHFDPATLLLATVRLGDEIGSDTPVHTRGNGKWMAELEDVNRDGRLDLVLHFSIPALVANGDLSQNSTTLVLTGQMANGHSASGEDVVLVIP